ncbi:hypothetical protein [Methylobacterium sp. WCS2018Hpa-22]|uniref:hypothetical protein n=1 Tax=Methylobacterium sp. WCS2018Hpa-22 TaxID=3073633 RepID=UPI00288B3399|nr:hypothetical protein [Methylobacterium sp. WCS2018Hpa-22]
MAIKVNALRNGPTPPGWQPNQEDHWVERVPPVGEQILIDGHFPSFTGQRGIAQSITGRVTRIMTKLGDTPEETSVVLEYDVLAERAPE